MNDQKYIISDSIGYLAGRVKRELTRLLARKLCDAGGQITAEQFSLLMMLWLEDGRNQQDLADLYGKDKTSIARMLQTMERHGLIIRVPDEKDKRNNLLYITQKGLEIRAKLFPTLQSSLQETEAGISAEKLVTCKSVLHKMVDHLSQINDDACKGNKGYECYEEETNRDNK